MVKKCSVFLAIIALCSFYNLISHTQPAYAASIHWVTDRVSLEASDFSIAIDGKTFVSDNVQLHSDPGTPAYTTLEATWNEQGVEMRCYLYFSVAGDQWKINEIRTYNGQASGDWLYYNGFTGGNLGSTYTSPSFDLQNNGGAGTGTIHFSNLRLLPSFVTQDYAIHITHPNGDEHVSPGATMDIQWNFTTPDRTDTNQTFSTSIYLQKNDGTTQTIVDNKSITHFNENTYHWTVPNIPSGTYKIYVYMNTPFLTAKGTQNLSDTSDGAFIVDSPTATVQPLSPSPSVQPESTIPVLSTLSPETQIPTSTHVSTEQKANGNLHSEEVKKASNSAMKKTARVTKNPSHAAYVFLDRILTWIHSRFHFFPYL